MSELDPATRARLRSLYPDYATRMIRVYADMERVHGVRMRMLEGVRLFSYQGKLFGQGRPGPDGVIRPGKIVTWAPPGFSNHHYGVGSDSGFVGADPYLERQAQSDPKRARELWSGFGLLVRAHGCTWGGDWDGDGIESDEKKPDRPHAEMRYGGLSEGDMLRLLSLGGIRAVWSRFDKIRGVVPGHEWDHPPTLVRPVEPDDISVPRR